TVVILELDPPAQWVADYYPVEEVQELPGGRLRVRLRAADGRWLRTLALQLAGSAQILEPAELAEEVRSRARTALAAYPNV
ncbi:MAG: proteasome accessory factor, partial [Actinomycetota bacterium]|nr:proteasome accessory factor [Actinomycetota bacterium]